MLGYTVLDDGTLTFSDEVEIVGSVDVAGINTATDLLTYILNATQALNARLESALQVVGKVHVTNPTDIQALADAIGHLPSAITFPSQVDISDENMQAITEALVKAGSKTAGMVSKIRQDIQLRNSGGTIIDPATESTLQQIIGLLSGTSTLATETRLDYDGRLDGNPVYVGTATQGTATSAATWSIKLLEYDATARLTRQQQLTEVVWDDRATLGWS